MSLCTVISANRVNLSSPVLLQMYVFSHFRVGKLLSTEAVVTGSKIERHLGGGGTVHLYPSLAYATV